MQSQRFRFSHLLLWVCCAHQITCLLEEKVTYGIKHNLPDELLPAACPSIPTVGEMKPLSNEESMRVGMKSIPFKTSTGRGGSWEFTHRKIPGDSRVQGTAPVMGLVTLVKRPGEETEMLFVKQYRIPNQKFVLEFPRGFVEKDETMQAAAHRVLKTETMFDPEMENVEVTVGHITYPLAKDPGLSSEQEIRAMLTIHHKGEKPKVQEDEDSIMLNLVPLSQLKSYVAIHSHPDSGYMVDASLDHYVAAIDLGRELERSSKA